MTLSAASKIAESGIMPYINTYDTETNKETPHLHHLSQKYSVFEGIDLFDEQAWVLTDRTKHTGNKWYKILKDYLTDDKLKNIKRYISATPMMDKNGNAIETILPTFGELDSLSEFSTDDVEKIQDEVELGDSAGNTIHMRSGLVKTRLVMDMPALLQSSGHYMTVTAHLGTAGPQMQTGPMAPRPTKQLPHMKPGEKIKGVTDKFVFLTGTTWQIDSASILINQGTKGPEFPKTRDQVDEGSKDLNLVQLTLVRNKFGSSGYPIQLIVSQTEGVLPSLSEFYYCKENDRYGLEGTAQHYGYILLPDVKFQRTTVREMMDTNPLLRRAAKITADLLQIKNFYKDSGIVVPDVKDLYEKLEKQYGWNVLLNTRDFWTFNQYEHPVPFLSTLDLIEMYYDRYIPYFLR